MPTRKRVLAALDQFFAPDIRLKLDSQSRIIGVEAISETGASLLLEVNLLDRDYDSLKLSGVVFEILD